MINFLKRIKLTYKVILFGFALLFIIVYTAMFVFHLGNSFTSSIKYRFFTFKHIYIVTDLSPADKAIVFVSDYLYKQSLKRYKYSVVSFDECQKNRSCMERFGIIISQNVQLIDKFNKQDLIGIGENSQNMIKYSGGSIIAENKIIIIRGRNNELYYYAVGKKAPFSGLLTDLPVSVMNII